MNRLNRALYLLPIALVAMACDRAEGHDTRERRARSSTVTITRTWPASAVKDLRVFEVDGSVSVEASGTTEISLVATATGYLDVKKGEENDGLFQTKLEGETLSIGRREHGRKGRRRFVFDFDGLFHRRQKRVNYALRVPPTLTLDISTVNGRIVTRGVSGATEAATVNGTIDIETVGTQELQATTVNGRVRAKFLESFQGARFKTVNGGVEAILPQNASFAVDLSQVNGDFEASFPLSIHSNPGSRRVSGEVNGGRHELKITTVNGDVQLARLNGAL